MAISEALCGRHIHRVILTMGESPHIVELRIVVEFRPAVTLFSVHVIRGPATQSVSDRGDDNDPAVSTGRGSGEDDGKQLQSQ